jgi:hypothetical protein
VRPRDRVIKQKGKEVKEMNRYQLRLSLLLAGLMGSTTIAAAASAPANQPKGVKPGVIGAVALNREGSYCHLRFPAIRPTTLTSAKPQLKPASSRDIIDYYGACDHDPVGKEEVQNQKEMASERLDNDYQ